MIEIRDLTKTYGDKTAVDHLTVTVRPGVVTGFLGPNGAGKSTTMRTIVGLDRPTGGEVLVNGRRYADLPAPLREVGALLEARAFHPGRSAYHHLLALAATGGLGKRRVHEVLDMVGLDQVAGKRTRGFSMGMGQRLGIAAALLGDPAVVLLDEPINGLDPDGIRWVRGLLRATEDIATMALANQILVYELTPIHPSLEDAYLALTHDDIEYQPAVLATVPATSTRRAAA
jgi:ABC-2 type transport system ATP-binding protein